jgi:multiple sugar transport system ATP-binding protein
MPAVEFIDVTKRYADGTVAVGDLNIAIEEGEYLCLLGPSGCGKSSTLRMLAGLETVSAGEIRMGGKRLNEVPPQDRDMAMVFENYALYPHLTVKENIAMPLVARGVPRSDIWRRVKAVAETLMIVDQLPKYPSQLSGGQRQRVAVGRAIVRTPKMFLMDEPLGHLEAYLRVQLRAELRRLHERLAATTVHITHDQEEAAAVSDRIAVLNKGRLEQVGSLLDLLDRPVNRFVAEFIGSPPINLLAATLASEDGRPVVRLGECVVPLDAEQAVRLRAVAANGQLTFGIRPQDVDLAPDGAAGTLVGRAAVLEPQGDATVVIVDTNSGRISALVPSHRAPPVDGLVRCRVTAARAHLFSADGTNLFAWRARP